MKNSISILFAIFFAMSCQNNKIETETDTKKETMTEQTANTNKSLSIIESKLNAKIGKLKSGDNQKVLVAIIDNHGKKKELNSSSTSNTVKLSPRGSQKKLVIVNNSKNGEGMTRIFLIFDSKTETGTFDVKGTSFYTATRSRNGVPEEITSAYSFMEGTVSITENDGNLLKGTANLKIPVLTMKENGAKIKELKDIEIEVGFYSPK